MARRTPNIRTRDGRTLTASQSHAAQYSEHHFPVFGRLLAAEAQRHAGRRLRVLDPMAGLGGIHHLNPELYETVANEIEPVFVEVARQLHPDRETVCGDAAALAFPDGSFDAVVVSPDFGNRLCMPAGTLVMTTIGYRPIEQIEAGEMVLTHEGRWRRVTWAGQTGVMSLVEVRGQGAGRLRMTENHRVLARRNLSTWQTGQLGCLDWVPAAKLGDRRKRLDAWRWGVPAAAAAPLEVPAVPDGFTAGPAFWWGVGFWLAQGSGRHTTAESGAWTRSTVDFCHGTYRVAGIDEKLRAAFGQTKVKVGPTRDGTDIWMVYSGALLAWLWLHFGRHSHGKTMPGWCLCLPDADRAALLNGYLDGDGCPHDHGNRAVVTVNSVSRPLLRGVQLLAHSVGRSGTFSQGKTARVEMVNGRACEVRDSWQLKLTAAGRSKFAIHDESIDWFAVRSVEPVDGDPVPVYDIEVDEDHSFVAEGVIVHNSDHHANKDACKRCKGSGRNASGSDCRTCWGFGVSLRRSYTHDARRLAGDPDYQLDPRNSGTLSAKSPRYWERQHAYWSEALRVLRPGGLMLLDVKDFVEGDKVVAVVAGHRRILEDLGFTVEAEVPVVADGLRNGANRDAREKTQTVLVARKLAIEAEVAA